MGRLRRRATIARKAIAQILETAHEYGFDGEEWSDADPRDRRPRARAEGRRAAGRDGSRGQEPRAQAAAARERLEHLLGMVEIGPKGPENRPHIYNYKPTLYPEQDTVIAPNACSGKAETRVSQSSTPVQPKRPDKGMVHGIAPDELVQLAPKLKPYLRWPDPTWPEIVDAADWLRDDLGVSKSLWGDACLAMGRELAAIALAIVSTKEADHFRTSPGGYFHGMVAKHGRRIASRTHGLGPAPRDRSGTLRRSRTLQPRGSIDRGGSDDRTTQEPVPGWPKRTPSWSPGLAPPLAITLEH